MSGEARRLLRAEALASLLVRLDSLSILALSIKQPYPHHIFHDGKDVENRNWATSRRGWFLIHAGVSTSELDDDQMHLPRGGVVGAACIVDCVTDMDSRWFFGRYGFVLRDAVPLPLIPCRGQQGFFVPPGDVVGAAADAVRTALAAEEGRA